MSKSSPDSEPLSHSQGSERLSPSVGRIVPDVSVVIVNWNSKDYVRQCLHNLQLAAGHLAIEVIVVDGGSFDGCGEMVSAEFPTVHFVQSPKNVGFGNSNNLGVEHSTGNLLLLLNPDTEIAADALSILLEHFRRLPQPGVLGARLLNSDGTLQESCVQSFPTALNQALDADCLRKLFPDSRLWGTNALRESSRANTVEAVSGACMLMSAETFRRVGGFTTQYFMYGEDLDLCFKVKQAGLLVYYVPSACIIHHGGGSSKTRFSKFSTVLMRQSVFRFLRLNRGRYSAFCYRCLLCASAFARIGILAFASIVANSASRKTTRISLSKWFAILRWSLGLERWAENPVA